MGTNSIAPNAQERKSNRSRYHVDPDGYGVDEEIENGILRQAWRIGSEHGNYDEIEDLAQEGRIAAWMEATLHDSRVDYCLHRSRQAMAQYARSGVSVNGRLWLNARRKRVYYTDSLDYPLSSSRLPEDTTLLDILPDPRPYTEKQAFSHIALSDIASLLTDDELEIARAKAAGFTLTELANLGIFTRWETEEYSRNVRRKVATYLNRPDLLPKPRIRKDSARFR